MKVTKKLEVLFIARRFPPSIGGMERFAFDLSNSLKPFAKMHKVTWGGSNKWLPIILPLFFIRSSFLLITNKNIKVIHIQDAVQAPVGWLLHIFFKKPYVVVAHGLDITYQNSFYQKVVIPFVRKADAVICISTATKDEALKRGVDESVLQVVTLGTVDDYGKVRADKKKLAKQMGYNLDERLIILTTGRLVKRKGVEWFIRNVLPEITNSHKEILYIIAGDGVEREAIENTIKSSKMEKHAIMLGRVSDEIRSLLYQSSDIFVMPNIRVPGDMEGFGIVAHEAATAALPVVASSLEGINDAIINGKNGILIEPNNTQQFVDAIIKLVKDKDLRSRLGRKARKYTLSAYSWQNIARKYNNIYNKIIN